MKEFSTLITFDDIKRSGFNPREKKFDHQIPLIITQKDYTTENIHSESDHMMHHEKRNKKCLMKSWPGPDPY